MTTTPTPTQPAAVPEALRLAASLEYESDRFAGSVTYITARESAAELRRLHALVTTAPAEPSPELQRMTADRAVFFLERFLREEKLLGPNEQAAVRFAVAALESPQAEQPGAAVPHGWKLVPVEFVRGFSDLAHNYSLRAEPPFYYGGIAGDAFRAAYQRCGEDLAKLRCTLAAAPAPTTEQAGAEKCPSCRNGDLYACTCPFPAAPGGEAPAEDALPVQPVHLAEDGVIRFRRNRIVDDLYEFARPRGLGLNELAARDYSPEERMQFAQLIGYSVSGYGSLSYASEESVARADRIADALAAQSQKGGAA